MSGPPSDFSDGGVSVVHRTPAFQWVDTLIAFTRCGYSIMAVESHSAGVPMRPRHAFRRFGATVAIAVMTMGALGGCAGSGTLSCQDYAEKSFEEKGEVIRSLLSENRLEPTDSGNVLGASTSIDGYCGTFGPMPGSATRNVDSAVEGAIDWDSPIW